MAVCITTVAAPLPPARSATRAQAPSRSAGTTQGQIPVASNSYFLRDAVPASGFTSEPEDSTDEAFLPEEEDTSKLVWSIAAWVVGAAIVAFFIIKVFIEEEPDEPDDGGNPKPDPF